MSNPIYTLGTKVIPADTVYMLELCDTYSLSGIAYGIVAEARPEYYDSVGIQWVDRKTGDTRPTVFWFHPSVLSLVAECPECGAALLTDPNLCDSCGYDHGYRCQTSDMFLVYEDSAGDLHYQSWRDLRASGTLTDPLTDADMEIIGWRSEIGSVDAGNFDRF